MQTRSNLLLMNSLCKAPGGICPFGNEVLGLLERYVHCGKLFPFFSGLGAGEVSPKQRHVAHPALAETAFHRKGRKGREENLKTRRARRKAAFRKERDKEGHAAGSLCQVARWYASGTAARWTGRDARFSIKIDSKCEQWLGLPANDSAETLALFRARTDWRGWDGRGASRARRATRS